MNSLNLKSLSQTIIFTSIPGRNMFKAPFENTRDCVVYNVQLENQFLIWLKMQQEHNENKPNNFTKVVEQEEMDNGK